MVALPFAHATILGGTFCFMGEGKGENFALASTIVCCGASTVAHFARKVRGANT